MDENNREPFKDEYRGQDGIIRCRYCGEPRQYKFKLWDEERIVPCKCSCQMAKEKKIEYSPFEED